MQRANDVIVVGAGPVGLTLATALVARGVSVTMIEAGAALSTDWRASTFHPPTLEMLEEFGIVGEMLERGLIADKYQVRDRSRGLIAEFDLRELGSDTKYPFRLQFEQYKYSQILLRNLSDHPLFTIQWSERVSSVAEISDGVQVASVAADGTEVTRVAQYVIGADGAKSAVRRSLGLELEGHTYPVRFLILSSSYPFEKRFPDLALVNYIWDPVEPVMLLRIPDVWRVMFSVSDDVSDDMLADRAAIQQRLKTLIGDEGPAEVPVSSVQYYSVHQRVAARFRVGRVLLAGDAGHINSPVGGLGMNSGIHDAMQIAPAVVAAISDGDDEALTQVAAHRRQVALDTVRAITDRNTREMTEKDDDVRRANALALQSLASDPAKRHKWLLQSSMLAAVR
ncbi:NAD(P)/FAD-dependent oxidoreductase [Amycolatopsis sp. GM8]|uniref:FAD-dependent oxidoreductase n=1 Tax=Amycolatopsis sp. GM8 TaxID=2896530 RepID=UPI001F469299|nr:NAD(P)/FAD-dependent oxidoreductase [Amycolatopsis sp. GM8]